MRNFAESIRNQKIRKIRARVEYFDNRGDIAVIDDSEIMNYKVAVEANMASTALHSLTLEYIGEHDLLGKELTVYYKIIVDDAENEICLGTYIVESIVKEEDKETVMVEARDYMLKFSKEFESLSLTYPCTLRSFVEGICEVCNVGLSEIPFRNEDYLVYKDKYTKTGATYRDALEDVAEVSNGIIYIKNGNLIVKNYEITDVKLNGSDLKSYKFEPSIKYNSLVLSRTPQEDNVYERDDDMIAIDGLHEVKLCNNDIIDVEIDDGGLTYDRRYLIKKQLFEECYKGVVITPFDAQTTGLGYLEIGDIIAFDVNGSKNISVIFGYEISIGNGMEERIFTNTPVKSTTEYAYSSSIDNRIKKTEIVVDKVDNKIEMVVSEFDDTNKTMAQILIEQGNITQVVSSINESIDATAESVNQMSINKAGVEFVNTVTSQIRNDLEKYGDKEYYERFIKFIEGRIILGTSQSPFSVEINNSEIGFYDSGTRVAYMNNKILYITNAMVDKLSINEYTWKIDSRSNLNLVKGRRIN